MRTDVGTLMPVTVIAFEVWVEFSGTPVSATKANGSGLVSGAGGGTSVVAQNWPETPPIVNVAQVRVPPLAADVKRTLTVLPTPSVPGCAV